MKSISIPIAELRSGFAEVLDGVRQGDRIRITRHGKPVAWIIGKHEHAILERYEARFPKPRSRPRRSSPRVDKP